MMNLEEAAARGRTGVGARSSVGVPAARRYFVWGPIAHLGYFRDELVVRRRWIDEAGYGDLVALCQFLPGPARARSLSLLASCAAVASSAGLPAWVGFTVPSALALVAFALGAASFTGALAEGLLHGLKLVAVAVVAQAVWGMAQSLTPDRTRAAIALAAIAIVTFIGGSFGQIGAIGAGALAGSWLCRGPGPALTGQLRFPVTRRQGAVLLVCLRPFCHPAARRGSDRQSGVALFDAFYRSGALVFGGGHVVLPLLQSEVVAPGWVTNADFLAGYGLAQAVPGPLFTFAAYLGAVAGPEPHGLAGAAIALVAIFLPGLLLVYGMLPFWDELRTRPLRAGCHARRQCGGRRHSGRCSLRSRLDERGIGPARFCARPRRISAAHGLEGAAMDRGRAFGSRWRGLRRDLTTPDAHACGSAKHSDLQCVRLSHDTRRGPLSERPPAAQRRRSR